MDLYDFYKSKFDRELKRRIDLDNSINSPIAGITIIVGLCSYILKNNNFRIPDFGNLVIIELLALTGLAITISLVFIFLSINNLFKGHKYLNYDLLSEYRRLEKECDEYNKLVEENQQQKIEEILKDKIVKYSDNHTLINDKRSKFLYYSRLFIIISFIIIFINLLFSTIKNFNI